MIDLRKPATRLGTAGRTGKKKGPAAHAAKDGARGRGKKKEKTEELLPSLFLFLLYQTKHTWSKSFSGDRKIIILQQN